MAAIGTTFDIIDKKLVLKTLEPIVGCGEADGDGELGTDDEPFQSEPKVPSFSSL